METIFNPLQINSVDLLLVGGHSILSNIIKKVENCNYSHGAMFFRLDTDTNINGVLYPADLYVAEMIAAGLKLTPFSNYSNDNSCKLLILKPKFPVDSAAYWNHVMPEIDKIKYGYANLICFQLVKFITNRRLWIGSDDNNPKRLICGEFCEYEINHFNKDYFMDWKRSSPDDIFNSDLFTQYEYKRELIP